MEARTPARKREPESESLLGGKPSEDENGVVGEEAAAAQARDGLPEAGEPTTKEANTALERMLSHEAPPLPTERINMPELADRMAEEQFTITVRALTDEEFEQIGERAERQPTKKERDKGQTMPVVDRARLKRLIVAEAMVDPDLTTPGLLEKFGPHPEHVVRRWFLPGEIDQLSDIITDKSGWSAGALERAKG